MLNLLFFLFVFPIVSYVYLQLYDMIQRFIPEIYQEIVNEAVAAGQESPGILNVLPTFLFSITSSLPIVLYIALLAVSVLLYGPMSCGFTYVLRNYARQEHAWMSDFFVQMKKNFVQGLIAGLLEISVVSLLLYNIFLQPVADMGMVVNVAKYVSIFLFIIVLFMRNYIYMIIVTFNMKLRHIFKNALIFSVLGLFRNILIVVVTLIFIGAILFIPWADIILVPLFIFSFCGFLAVFACWPIIHKFMIAPTQVDSNGGSDDGNVEDTVQRVDPKLLGGE